MWTMHGSQTPETYLDSGTIIQGGHLLAGVTPLPLEGRTEAEWLWRQPS